MVDLKHSEIRFIEETVSWPGGLGYVLNFSDRTFSEWFEDEFQINIEDQCFLSRGTSKRNRLISFLQQAPSSLAAKVLHALWEERQELKKEIDPPSDSPDLHQKWEQLASDILCRGDEPQGDAFFVFEKNETLEELISDLERDLQANKPAAMLDHLHTYCTKKMRHLLTKHGVTSSREEPLHSLFSKYRKILVSSRSFHPLTDNSLKSSIRLMETFGNIRNEHSFAHDNQILPEDEARLAFDQITAVLRFLRNFEAESFE